MELITLILGAIIGIFASKYGDTGLPDFFSFPTLSYDALAQTYKTVKPSRTIPIYVYEAHLGNVDALGSTTLPYSDADARSLSTVAALVVTLFLVLGIFTWHQLTLATERLPLVTDVQGDDLTITLSEPDYHAYVTSCISDASSIHKPLAGILRRAADLRSLAYALPTNGTGILIPRTYPTTEMIPLLRYLDGMLNAEKTVAEQLINILHFLWTIGDHEAQIAHTINCTIGYNEMEARIKPQIFEIDRLEGEIDRTRISFDQAKYTLQENERLKNALRNKDRGMDFEKLERKLSIQEDITKLNAEALRKKDGEYQALQAKYEALEVEHHYLEQSTGWMHDRIEEL